MCHHRDTIITPTRIVAANAPNRLVTHYLPFEIALWPGRGRRIEKRLCTYCLILQS